jgi:hypothetical protein
MELWWRFRNNTLTLLLAAVVLVLFARELRHSGEVTLSTAVAPCASQPRDCPPCKLSPPSAVAQPITSSPTAVSDLVTVESFLANARLAVAQSQLPQEPFMDDTTTPRFVLNEMGGRVLVGSQWAAIALSEGIAMPGLNITGVLNVAFDLDVVYSGSEFVGQAEESNRHHKLQLGKVGLVDGPGNHVGTLAAAVLLLRQMLDFKEELLKKDIGIFPAPVRSVLVHW